MLYADDVILSRWARDILAAVPAPGIAVCLPLLHELGGKTDTAPELVAVAELPPDDLARIRPVPGLLTVLFDRPAGPGNIGSVIRSADALGASGVIISGHAADPYDPQAVRASTGSLFSVPTVRVPSHRPVLDWAESLRARGLAVRIVGTDENAGLDLDQIDFTRPTLVLVGNETAGLSAAWRESCDATARIPMSGSASSLNAAAAAAIVLYEAARQRARADRSPGGE
jgi:TrmH family RNA methyltransferase